MDLIFTILTSAIIGALCGGLTLLVVAILPRKPCPGCGRPVPKWQPEFKRRGWSVKKSGWKRNLICGECGCEFTAKRKIITPGTRGEGSSDTKT